MRIYIDGILQREDNHFSPTEFVSFSSLAFGDQATSYDHTFELDYLRAGAAIVQPPLESILILQ